MTSHNVGSDQFFYAFHNKAKSELRLIYEKYDPKLKGIVNCCFNLDMSSGYRSKLIFKAYDLSGFDEMGRKVMRDYGEIKIYDDHQIIQKIDLMDLVDKF